MYGILNSISDSIKDEDKTNFNLHYWVLKTHGNIALAFKDIKEAAKAFVQAKHLCELKRMYTHKMIVYK